MGRTSIGKTVKMAVCVLGATLACSGLALAQYNRDDGYYRRDYGQAQQQGYQKGYNDGIGKGRHQGRERDANGYQTSDWRKATRGYKNWMGPVDVYQSAYREGYRDGFRAGYNEVAGNWHDGHRGYGWASDGWRTGYDRDGANIANRFGYEDGSEAAREDIYNHKDYNSKPRGRFGGRDHGYRSEFGSRDRYKAEYTAGYRTGYDSVMLHRRY